MPLEQLLRAAGGLAAAAYGGAPGNGARMWEELRPWLQRLLVEAAPRWIPTLSRGFQCTIPVMSGGQAVSGCPGHAIAACCVCQQACCLTHSMISGQGHAICFHCVGAAQGARRGVPPSGARPGAPPAGVPPPPPAGEARRPPQPRPRPADVAWARKVLGVTGETPWAEVRRSARKKMGRWHPDKRTGNEAKFAEVQRALETLETDKEAEAAA